MFFSKLRRGTEGANADVLGKHDVGSLSHSHGQRQGRYGSQSHEGRSSQSVRSERGGGVGGIGFE